MRRWLPLLLLVSCRDEQAGPRPRGQPQQQQQAAQPQQPQAQPGQPQQGQLRTLDAIPPQVKLTFQGTGTWADGTVAYLGTMVEPAILQPGQPVRLSHFFRADKPPPQGYRFFVHVVDAASGQMAVNADHEIQQGNGPLETWPVGRIVFDQHVFQMPEGTGPLRAVLGFWKDDGRLPVDQAPLQDGQNRMLGPKLEAGGGPQLPEYKTPRTAKAPVIDGKVNDDVWKAAPEVTLTASYDGRPVSRKTTARILWDEQFLYVAFDCEDPDVWGTKRNKDDDIYNEDAVEVFVNASGDLANYNELQVSPHNVNFDARFVSRRSDLPTAMKWESGMTTAVDVRGTLDDDTADQGWSAEMKIPIANLANVPHAPQKGDVWRFNLYRLEHLKRRTEIEGQSFSPLFVGDFHALPRFGKLVFE
ncbi:MAG: carbohydrate-binding family 9-like protein [Myxococcaceae bacterium]|nr:carbohydrate-binding family 9-like protein [Myxococcaceae bacterium]